MRGRGCGEADDGLARRRCGVERQRSGAADICGSKCGFAAPLMGSFWGGADGCVLDFRAVRFVKFW